MDQAAFIAITVGLVQVIKIAMPKSALLNRFIPVIALVIGVAVHGNQSFYADYAIATPLASQTETKHNKRRILFARYTPFIRVLSADVRGLC